MARYRKIDVRIWGDEKFRRLSAPQPCGQSLLFFLMTNPMTWGIPGLFRGGVGALSEELGWPAKAFQEAFQEVSSMGIAKADWEARVVWIPNAIRYNAPASPNVVKSWRTQWDELPECLLKDEAYQHIKAFLEGLGEAFAKAFREGCAGPSSKTLANKEQEQDQDQEQEQEGEREREPFERSVADAPAPPSKKSSLAPKVRARTPSDVSATEKRAKPKTGCPPITDPTVDSWLADQQLPALDSRDGAEVARFLDHHTAKGSRWVSWAAAWRTWKAGWDKFGEHQVGPAPGRRLAGPQVRRGELPPMTDAPPSSTVGNDAPDERVQAPAQFYDQLKLIGRQSIGAKS